MVHGIYGDMLVSVDGGWAYGIDGCTVSNMIREDDRIDLEVISDINWVTPMRIVFRDVPPGNYKVLINGQSIGEFPAADLVGGIECRAVHQRW